MKKKDIIALIASIVYYILYYVIIHIVIYYLITSEFENATQKECKERWKHSKKY